MYVCVDGCTDACVHVCVHMYRQMDRQIDTQDLSMSTNAHLQLEGCEVSGTTKPRREVRGFENRNTHRLQGSSFLGLPYRIPKK